MSDRVIKAMSVLFSVIITVCVCYTVIDIVLMINDISYLDIWELWSDVYVTLIAQ